MREIELEEPVGEFLFVENAPFFERASTNAEIAASHALLDRVKVAQGVYFPALNFFVQAAEAAEPAFPAQSLDDDVVMIGHSLVDPLPAPLQHFVTASGGRGEIRRATIPGAPLEWNWKNNSDAHAMLGQGGTEVLVITERVPVSAVIEWHDAQGYALLWHDLAVASKSGAQTYLYESWTDLRSGTERRDEEWIRDDPENHIPWRERLNLDLPRWEGLADHVNAHRASGSNEMRIIPAGQALARLHDEIAQGNVPEVTDIRAFFADDIHVNAMGAYFVSLVHYATLYGRSPVGLPHRIPDGDAVPPELARKLQEIAWKAVTDYQSMHARDRS